MKYQDSQKAKVLAVKPETHMVEGQTDSCKVSGLPHELNGVCAHTSKQILVKTKGNTMSSTVCLSGKSPRPSPFPGSCLRPDTTSKKARQMVFPPQRDSRPLPQGI